MLQLQNYLKPLADKQIHRYTKHL